MALDNNTGVVETLRRPLLSRSTDGPCSRCAFAGVLYGGVAVHVGQEFKAEAVLVVGQVGEAVHEHAGEVGVVGLAHALFQFVVLLRSVVFFTCTSFYCFMQAIG